MNIRQQLMRDEGCKLHAYRDSLGYWTIGVGFLIDPRKVPHAPNWLVMPHGVVDDSCTMSQADCDKVLDEKIRDFTSDLENVLPWVEKLDDARKGVLINMAFNLGLSGLLTFKSTLSMIEHGNYASAAVAMLQSKWAAQVHARADRLAKQMQSGEWV